MGSEIGQTTEWSVDDGVAWHLLDHPPHQGVQALTRDLNYLYKTHTPLHQYSFEGQGFSWIDHSDHDNCILAYLRRADDKTLLVVCNFTPTAQDGYRLGVPAASSWRELLNTNNNKYWGSHSHQNEKILTALPEGIHGQPGSIALQVPPLGVTILEMIDTTEV